MQLWCPISVETCLRGTKLGLIARVSTQTQFLRGSLNDKLSLYNLWDCDPAFPVDLLSRPLKSFLKQLSLFRSGGGVCWAAFFYSIGRPSKLGTASVLSAPALPNSLG